MPRRSRADQAAVDASKGHQFNAGESDPPPSVTGRALEVWNETIPSLREFGLATKVEAFALAEYCTAVANSELAQQAIDERGVLVETERGTRMNPAFTAKNQAATTIHKFCAAFGITPANRVRINFKPKAKESKFAKFKK